MIFFPACGKPGVEASIPLRRAHFVCRANCFVAIVSVAQGWTLPACLPVPGFCELKARS